MSNTQSPNPIRQFICANLAYFLGGKLRTKNGHLPPSGHSISHDFVGIGVTTTEDAAADDFIIARLQELGIRHVRLDFTYGDAENHVARFLQRLCAESFSVTLHLVQPFQAAKLMGSASAQQTWKDFVAATLDSFGKKIELVEIGSTINRKRWAGYTLQGFFAAWEIAHDEIRRRNIKLAGPNITDFEPLYNIGILSILKSRGQLPDIQTDNLFSERCTEPERFDHKIIGRKLAPLIKFNLVKKARVLQKIGANFGVPELHSPTAFWTLPRIQRLLQDSEEKQADYLARYMLLCATSGALRRVSWGPLVCHREGLIDDGIAQYPSLERITHYASIGENVAKFQIRPAFHTMKTFTSLIPGTFYEGSLASANGLEIHAFKSAGYLIHAVWTINGKAAALADVYSAGDLSAAECIARDGDAMAVPALASESPIYLRFPAAKPITINSSAKTIKSLSIYRHIKSKTYCLFSQNGWRGLLLAKDAKEEVLLGAALYPEHIGPPPQDAILRKARNAIWTIPDPRDASRKLVIKQPVKMHFHKKLLDRFRPSKALRSWNGANELLRRGIETAQPIAYFEQVGDASLTNNYYVCEHVEADFSVRKIFSAFASGGKTYQGVAEEDAYRQLCDYLFTMHSRGVFFRDLSGGNILVKKSANNKLAFPLIDTGRAHFFNHGTSLSKRIADLTRVCNKLHAAGRDRFMALYLARLGMHFGFWQRLPFHIYNAKVAIKRNLKRKNLIKLFKQK